MKFIHLFKGDLAREIKSWHADGIIGLAQAEKLCARYGVDYHDKSAKTYGYYVLLGLGFLFLGLSMLVVVGENWQDWPRGARMGGLIALTLITNLAGVYRYHRNQRVMANVLFLLGGLLYGASIMLIAQIYHLGEHYPDGVLWWALGVAPMAILTRSAMLMLLTMTLALIWFLLEIRLDFFPSAFVLFLLANAWFIVRAKSSLLLFMTLVVGVGLLGEAGVSWLISDEVRFDHSVPSVVFVWGYAIFLYGLSQWLAAQWQSVLVDYGAALSLWLMRCVLLGLLVMSFADPWEQMLQAEWRSSGAVLTMFAALCVAGIALSAKSRHSTAGIVIVSIIVFSVVGLLLIIHDDRYALLFQILDNLALIIAGVGLIIQGIKRVISRYFYVGGGVIMLTALLRYFNLVGDYIGAAILFMIFALIMLAAAAFWKSHVKEAQ